MTRREDAEFNHNFLKISRPECKNHSAKTVIGQQRIFIFQNVALKIKKDESIKNRCIMVLLFFTHSSSLHILLYSSRLDKIFKTKRQKKDANCKKILLGKSR